MVYARFGLVFVHDVTCLWRHARFAAKWLTLTLGSFSCMTSQKPRHARFAMKWLTLALGSFSSLTSRSFYSLMAYARFRLAFRLAFSVHCHKIDFRARFFEKLQEKLFVRVGKSTVLKRSWEVSQICLAIYKIFERYIRIFELLRLLLLLNLNYTKLKTTGHLEKRFKMA